jgi:large subunit ribosomal protein L15
VSDLNKLDAGEITGETLKKAGLVKNTQTPIKILGNGELEKAFTIKANAFSKTAISKIEAAGGKAEVV